MSYVADGNTLTMTPDDDLAAGTTFTVEMGVFYDLVGRARNFGTTSFTTAPN